MRVLVVVLVVLVVVVVIPSEIKVNSLSYRPKTGVRQWYRHETCQLEQGSQLKTRISNKSKDQGTTVTVTFVNATFPLLCLQLTLLQVCLGKTISLGCLVLIF